MVGNDVTLMQLSHRISCPAHKPQAPSPLASPAFAELSLKVHSAIDCQCGGHGEGQSAKPRTTTQELRKCLLGVDGFQAQKQFSQRNTCRVRTERSQ